MTPAELQEAGVTDPAVVAASIATDPNDFPMPPGGHGQVRPNAAGAAILVQEVVRCKPRKVLEIGTGSGYTTTLLLRAMPLVRVVSLERNSAIALNAVTNLVKADVYRGDRLETFIGDGSPCGVVNQGNIPPPYDLVLVTAAAPLDRLRRLLFTHPIAVCLIQGPDGAFISKFMRYPDGAIRRFDVCPIAGATPLEQGVV